MNTTPANDVATRTAKKITVWEIKSRDRKRFGRVYPGQTIPGAHAEIVPGKSIRLFGMIEAGTLWVRDAEGKMGPCEAHVYRKDFAIGDIAEYDSYNLSYCGTIVAITEKTVSIREDGSRVHRLDLAEFSRRNWNFDAEKVAKRNAEWLD
jgi:hypothetical protein